MVGTAGKRGEGWTGIDITERAVIVLIFGTGVLINLMIIGLTNFSRLRTIITHVIFFTNDYSIYTKGIPGKPQSNGVNGQSGNSGDFGCSGRIKKL